MSIISDPTTLDGPAQSAERNDLEELMQKAEQSRGVESVPVEPEAEDMLQLRARVARLEAQAVPHADGAPVRTTVSGRYRSAGVPTQLELCVDVDDPRPMKRISGDFFQTSGATTRYVGSFVVEAPTATTAEGLVKLSGQGKFSFPVVSPHVAVTMAQSANGAVPPGPATVTFSTDGGGPSASYLCSFVSPHFRSAQLEQDSVAGTVPFVSYDTGSLPQPPSSPARVLTVPAAYAEAGIEIQIAGTPNVIPTAAAGPDERWSDAELHNAMVNHFSLWGTLPGGRCGNCWPPRTSRTVSGASCSMPAGRSKGRASRRSTTRSRAKTRPAGGRSCAPTSTNSGTPSTCCTPGRRISPTRHNRSARTAGSETGPG